MDASVDAPVVEAYHAADRAGELTARALLARRVDNRRGEEQVAKMAALRDRAKGVRLRADAAKFFLDGEIDRHTAALLAPYADGFIVHMHAMGDRAIRAGLDAVQKAASANGPRDRRHQLAHLGVVDPADLPRFAKLLVMADLQPLFALPSDPVLAAAARALGPRRARWLYPLASIRAAGAGWLRAATGLPLRWQDDGVIAVGRPAELVVLDRNLFAVPPSSIHEARVLATLLDGEPAYRASGFEWPR